MTAGNDLALTGSSDGVVRIYNGKTLSFLRELTKHTVQKKLSFINDFLVWCEQFIFKKFYNLVCLHRSISTSLGL